MANHKLKKILTQMRDIGINEVPSSYLSLISPSESAQKKTPQKSPASAGRSDSEKLRTSHFSSLEKVKAEYADCKMCPLAKSRLRLVFGEGSARARLMVIGEGPGFTEDHLGRPFVGRSGNLLTDIITRGMKMKREDVYIANIVKCHPMKDPSDPEKHSNDRPPSPEEVSKCMPILLKQIDAIRPEVICTLGSPAAKIMLNKKDGISNLRGKIFDIRPLPDDPDYGVKLVPTFHPAYLLRNPPAKKPAWEDIKVVMGLLKK
ncbi:MAG: uracil-DNA glycosylase [Candidatus Omnitrophota bacterium]